MHADGNAAPDPVRAGTAVLRGGVAMGLARCRHAARAHWRRRPRRPLPERNRRRAGMGGFLVALALGLWAHGMPASLEPISAYLLPAMGGFGVVLLVGGIHGANGASFDFLDMLLWIAVAIGCAALLVFEGHFV